MRSYPLVTIAGQEINNSVDVESLSAQLTPIIDAFLELFDGAKAKGTGELHRLELGLAVTQRGAVAFAAGNATRSLTLTFESRQRTPSTRSATSRSSAAKKPDVVKVD
jgi:hypothetical protein